MESVAAVVIGAGVVGLACARALARRGIETVILERNDTFGSETSARNSEVIHAGLYYPTGSLKAALCVVGQRKLYGFCATHGISHRRCGKLIVATSTAQEDKLAALQQQGQLNGVDDLRLLSAAEARALEPALTCSAALLSPSTGIIDSRALMLSAARRCRTCRRLAGSAQPVLQRLHRDPRLHPRKWRQRQSALYNRHGNQCRRPLGTRSRRFARRFSGSAAASEPSCQRQLLCPQWPLALLAADLSAARERRPGDSSDDRSRRAGTLRPGRRVVAATHARAADRRTGLPCRPDTR
jgi:hypothetical protein